MAGRSGSAVVDAPKKPFNRSAAWREARLLLYAHRRRLLIGLVLMLVAGRRL